MVDSKKKPPKRASLYGIARILGISAQAIYQQAKRNPSLFPKGEGGLYEVEAVRKFIEGRSKPKLRKLQPVLAAPIVALLDKVAGSQSVGVADLLAMLEACDKAYIQATEALLKTYGLSPSQAVASFKTQLEGLSRLKDELKKKGGVE